MWAIYKYSGFVPDSGHLQFLEAMDREGYKILGIPHECAILLYKSLSVKLEVIFCHSQRLKEYQLYLWIALLLFVNWNPTVKECLG
jgi:hypothetical protein